MTLVFCVYFMAVAFSIKPAGSSDRPPVRVVVANLETKTIGELKMEYLQLINKPKMNINRIRFCLELSNEVLGPNEKVLSALQFPKEFTEISLLFKDLGPQISWRTVFIVEYFVPMVAFPIIYMLRRASGAQISSWQSLLGILFTLHFIKREFETIFIHRFGTDTMPIMNIFKNSGYYWLFAIWIAHTCLNPLYTEPSDISRRQFGVGLFAVCELLNLKSHIDLRNLRPAGTRIRQIPKGILFSLISCPNYLFEILAWVGFTIASQTVASGVYTLVGAAQMTLWALQKHKRYGREFDGKDGKDVYPKSRKAIVPFIL